MNFQSLKITSEKSQCSRDKFLRTFAGKEQHFMKYPIGIILLTILISSCNGTSHQTGNTSTKKEEIKRRIPEFNGDSAYQFVARQVAFGPRIPGSEAHTQCAKWMTTKLSSFGAKITVQDFRARVYNGTTYNGKNIIAAFNPQAKKRIILSSHWDSRPYGDHDPDPKFHRTPIDGANDGASGVGVLIEMARQFAQIPLDEKVGVDIILFDLEDFGPPTDERKAGDEDWWALGSQYWAANPHQAGYTATYGILLDMVGAKNAVFPREYFSMLYAESVMDKVWSIAYNLGYDESFVNQPGAPVDDDHLPVNQVARIPMIDIIHLDPNSSNQTFFEHWHTMNDNLDQIDPATLQMVGNVLTQVVYTE
jgi:Zn-dependent M28 family amino/carboxypeptidase